MSDIIEKMVIKRDGTKEDFNPNKIKRAVSKVFISKGLVPDVEYIDEIVNHIDTAFNHANTEMDIECIQDAIIEELKGSYPEIATEYSNFRDQRQRYRNRRSEILKAMQKKLDAEGIENSNANLDEMSFGGRKGSAMHVATKLLALDEYMSEISRTNHLENRIYIHDLDSYADGEHNCLSIPFDHLLKHGFNTRQTDVRPANGIGAAMQLVAVIAQIQSLQQFGGVSATHIDWTMVPYFRKSFYKHYVEGKKYINGNSDFSLDIDIENTSITAQIYKEDAPVYNYAYDMTVKECYQAVEGMFHNLNTLQSRSGNQLPFSSINYGTCTEAEGRIVTKALIEKTIEGVGSNHKTAIFPCQIFQYKRGVNDKPGTPNYDLKLLALRSTATRFYPNYANCNWSTQEKWIKTDTRMRQDVIDEMDKESIDRLVSLASVDGDVRKALGIEITPNASINCVNIYDPKMEMSTMGCRTCNGLDINFKEVYKRNINDILSGADPKDLEFVSGVQKDGRGNICPVTIILPEIAMEVKNEVGSTDPHTRFQYFLFRLSETIDTAKDMLLERFAHICSQSPESARFMYENNTMVGYVPSEGIRSALKHGTIVIGQLGLSECLYILFGDNHTNANIMPYAKEIEQLYNDKCNSFKVEYGLNFGVYMTPAESLCFTAMNKFKERHGVIENISDHDYFTNSMHVPVWNDIDLFSKIDIESELTGYSNAGCITYVELPASAKHNIEAMETIVDYAMNKDIPYFAINPTIDQCMNCGYTDEINNVCPQCGSDDIFRPRRVTGYLSTDYHHFNYGKQSEVQDRVKHVGGCVCR